MMKDSEDSFSLPAVYQKIVDEVTLDDFFRDLAHCAEVIQIIPKWREKQYVSQAAMTLEEAHGVLISQKVRGIQIRYRYEGAEWWDTLLHTKEGVEVTRIRHDFDSMHLN